MATVTHNQEDYLEAIYLLSRKGEGAQIRDIAKMLSVRMATVVKTLRDLKKQELAVQEPYQPVSLTIKGSRAAAQVLRRHNLIKSFLIKLGVSTAIADKDACIMEHILSAETLERIRSYMEINQNA